MDFDTTTAEDYIAADNRENSFKLKIKSMQHPLCEKLLKRALKSWVAKGYLWFIWIINKSILDEI